MGVLQVMAHLDRTIRRRLASRMELDGIGIHRMNLILKERERNLTALLVEWKQNLEAGRLESGRRRWTTSRQTTAEAEAEAEGNSVLRVGNSHFPSRTSCANSESENSIFRVGIRLFETGNFQFSSQIRHLAIFRKSNLSKANCVSRHLKEQRFQKFHFNQVVYSEKILLLRDQDVERDYRHRVGNPPANTCHGRIPTVEATNDPLPGPSR
ncbi:hypothetical protein OSB04_029080 [Centaurea solstitialis]|uniref:Uncharacterized protein n=1 Tax=Centaurea solstitialis TaxID=347529 RepID=A0AA38SIK3_9ASTR|nr:hypothetical protein OSB04_029080 [Centaurea solstitialis]